MKIRNVIIFVLVALLISLASASALSTNYEEEFRGMELEELLKVSDSLQKVINEKRIGNAVLIIDPAESTLAVGKTLKIAVSSDAREVNAKTNISFESSDENVATIKNGQISGVGPGRATIKATAVFEDGATLSAACEVTVVVPVTAIKAPQKATTFVNGQLNLRELVSIVPENASNQELIFSVDDKSVATVDEEGIIKGIKGGTVTVTISSAQKDPVPKAITVKVSVDEAVSDIKLNTTSFNVGKTKTYQLKAEVGPESATNKAVEWKTQDSSIATVSPTGVVTGKGTGTTIITCVAKDGSGASASAEVTVITSVNAIKFVGAGNGKEINLIEGKGIKAAILVSPTDATDKNVTWSSSNTGVATVDNKGNIKANSPGSCVISATATDGSGKAASIKVYVDPKNPIEVRQIHWQTIWGMKNGKMGVYGTSSCTHRKVKSFTCRIECTSYFGGTATDQITYRGSTIGPGQSKRGKLSSTSVSGFTTAATVKVTVISVTFADGTVYQIPSEDQETTFFSM